MPTLWIVSWWVYEGIGESMNKFRELKNKGKQRTKELPIQEPKVLDEVDVKTLLDSLNEEVEKVIGPTDFQRAEEPLKLEQGLLKGLQEVVAAEAPKEPLEKMLVAYCVAFNEKRNKFQKIEVKIDPNTGYAKIDSIVDWSDDPMTGLHKLNRILSLKLIKREEKF
jgi:hypothetical protein